MKKSVSFVLILLFAFGFEFSAFASNVPYRVRSEAVNAEKGESVSVPVSIENNGGIMGFSIVVTYDADIFTPVSAVKGAALSAGILNDSIETAAPGSFKVIYTGNANETADGVLFTLNFDLKPDAVGSYKIGLSYVRADTFKEGWGDVVLSCEDIGVTIADPDVSIDPPPTVPEKTLSERIIDRFRGLSAPLRILLGVFVIPLSFIISIFD